MEDVETLALYSRARREFDKMCRNRKRAYYSPSNYSQMAILRIPKWSISEKGSVYAYASCLIIQLILEHARKTCRESVFISIQACRLESMSNDNYIVISFGRSKYDNISLRAKHHDDLFLLFWWLQQKFASMPCIQMEASGLDWPTGWPLICFLTLILAIQNTL